MIWFPFEPKCNHRKIWISICLLSCIKRLQSASFISSSKPEAVCNIFLRITCCIDEFPFALTLTEAFMFYHMTTWKTLWCVFLKFIILSQVQTGERKTASNDWAAVGAWRSWVSACKCNYFSRMPCWPAIHRLCSVYQTSHLRGRQPQHACTHTLTYTCTACMYQQRPDPCPLMLKVDVENHVAKVRTRSHIKFSPDLIYVWMVREMSSGNNSWNSYRQLLCCVPTWSTWVHMYMGRHRSMVRVAIQSRGVTG